MVHLAVQIILVMISNGDLTIYHCLLAYSVVNRQYHPCHLPLPYGASSLTDELAVLHAAPKINPDSCTEIITKFSYLLIFHNQT